MNRSTSASWVKLIAGAAALSLTLAACGSEDPDDDGDAGAGEEDTQAADPSEMTDDRCTNRDSSDDVLKVAGILPLTGSLAFLGPPEVAGTGLAVSDINAAGGVADTTACVQMLDSGDADDASVGNASAQRAIRGNASVVVGAASSSVTLNFVDAVTDAGIVQISPANTAVRLSGYDDFYFRTAPPDGIQGDALGNLLLNDGMQRVAFIVFNDAYGTGLRDVVEETVTNGGGECVYGCKGDGQEFPPGSTSFSAEVSGAIGENPDAIVVLAFDETKSIVPEMQNQGWDMTKSYFTDGNTSDYSGDFDGGTLEGAKGTIPGADPDASFKERLSAWHEEFEGEALSDYSYGAESYDAVMLAALAAHKAGSTDPGDIQQNLADVSGASEGEECSTFADCIALLDEGSEIRYAGPSGIGPFDDENDPSSAFVGIYTFDAENKPELTDTVEGTK